MPFVDMSKPAQGQASPGTYRVVVKNATHKKSKSSGAEMFELELDDDATATKLCYDNIMLEGGGWGLGQSKLLALGIGRDFKGQLAAAELIGRKAYAALVVEEKKDEKSGRVWRNLRVDINEGSAGYWPIGAPPADLAQRMAASAPAPEPDLDNAPF